MVIAEIDQIISLLEARLPANPNSPENQRLEKRLQRDLAKYFRFLSDAFPYDKVDELYYKHVKEQLGAEAGDIIDALLHHFQNTLQVKLNGHLAEVYLSGSAEMVEWGATQAGIPITYEGPPIQQAVDYAEKQGAKLVTQMNEETKRRLGKVVSDGIKNKRGIPGLQRDIRKTFTDMSRYRSELIARTETSSALSQASLDKMEDMGIEGKEWITAGDERVSPECIGNEGEGIIPRNQMFSGGVMSPPQHPACRCSLAPAMLPTRKALVPEEKLSGDDWAKSLNRDEKQALGYWQGSGYEKIRVAQQTGKGPAILKGAVKNLNKSLDRAQPYKGQVFRGLNNLDKKTFNLIKNSKQIKWDALSSSAKTEKAAARFLRPELGKKGESIMFKIQNKSGVDLSPVYRGEAEVLLRKDVVYRIVGQTQKVYMVGKEEYKAWEIVLQEI